MGMQFLKNFLLKPADVAPIAPSPGLTSEWTEFIGRICVVASQGQGGAARRADKIYSCEDARLVASELNREWPSVKHWAAPATADEIKAHAVQAARLARAIAHERNSDPPYPSQCRTTNLKTEAALVHDPVNSDIVPHQP